MIVKIRAPTSRGLKFSVKFIFTKYPKNIKIGTVSKIETVEAPIAILITLWIWSSLAAFIAVKISGVTLMIAIQRPAIPVDMPKLWKRGKLVFAKISGLFPNHPCVFAKIFAPLQDSPIAFAKLLGIIKNKTNFYATDGKHKATIDNENNVNLKMKNVYKIAKYENDYLLDTGSPHYVKIVDAFSNDFVDEAKSIRHSTPFEGNGINVNFIKLYKDNVEIRTFERGVEDETLACGTGCVASALVAMKLNNNNKIFLKAKGGNLIVTAKKSKKGFKKIWLFGPTEFVFKGQIKI